MAFVRALGAESDLVDGLLGADVEDALPLAAAREATSSSSVDLPTPGSPDSSTAAPGTMPPPRTRSNSPMPVFHRCTAVPVAWVIGRATRAPATATGAVPGSSRLRPWWSSTVPHAWHSPQRPTHLMLVHPHSEQRYRGLGARHDVEARPPRRHHPSAGPGGVGVVVCAGTGAVLVLVLPVPVCCCLRLVHVALVRQRDRARHPVPEPLHPPRSLAVVELRRVLGVLLRTRSGDRAGLAPEVLGLARGQVLPDRRHRVHPGVHRGLERARPDLVAAVVRVEQVAVAVEERATKPTRAS